MPKIDTWDKLPAPVRRHLIERMHDEPSGATVTHGGHLIEIGPAAASLKNVFSCRTGIGIRHAIMGADVDQNFRHVRGN